VAARDRELSDAAPWRRWLGGGERDQLVQQTRKHGRPLVDAQHVGAASFHDVETFAPEAQPQRPRVATAAKTCRSEERLYTQTHTRTTVMRPGPAHYLRNKHTREKKTIDQGSLYGSSNAVITIGIRLRYDYNPTATYRARLQKMNMSIFHRSRIV